MSLQLLCQRWRQRRKLNRALRYQVLLLHVLFCGFTNQGLAALARVSDFCWYHASLISFTEGSLRLHQAGTSSLCTCLSGFSWHHASLKNFTKGDKVLLTGGSSFWWTPSLQSHFHLCVLDEKRPTIVSTLQASAVRQQGSH